MGPGAGRVSILIRGSFGQAQPTAPWGQAGAASLAVSLGHWALLHHPPGPPAPARSPAQPEGEPALEGPDGTPTPRNVHVWTVCEHARARADYVCLCVHVCEHAHAHVDHGYLYVTCMCTDGLCVHVYEHVCAHVNYVHPYVSMRMHCGL